MHTVEAFPTDIRKPLSGVTLAVITLLLFLGTSSVWWAFRPWEAWSSTETSFTGSADTGGIGGIGGEGGENPLANGLGNSPSRPLAAASQPTAAVQTEAWYSWSLLNVTTGERFGSANAATETNNTESMIKLWIGADYLTGITHAGGEPTDDDKRLLRKMIRSSDDNAAQTLYKRRGGNAMIQRMIDQAKLANTTIHNNWWSKTQMTAQDATTMFDYVIKRSKNEPWLAWLVNEARNVDASNAFGIPEGLPSGKTVAVKNGWTEHGSTGLWNLNSLGAWDNWILAVMTRYPIKNGQNYGAAICTEITEQLVRQIS